ncbi:MAG: response regulator [Pseudonocardiaceae bacterium]
MSAADEQLPDGTRAVRILVVDDHRTFAELLSFALQAEPGMECVGSAASAAEAIVMAAQLRPDVVVMDIQMPGQDGLSGARRIREELPEAAIAVVTAYRDPEWVVRAAQAGANAFVPKSGSLTEVLDVLHRVRKGHLLLSPSTFGPATAAPPKPDVATPTLTHRERDVLGLMGRAMPPRAIARVLGITLHTCRGYVKSIHSKLGARSQLEAVVRAQELGLVEAPDQR